MLPSSYATPVAAILAVSGFVACFAGYRLFRIVLGVYGFILGAMVTTSVMGTDNTWALVMAAAVGGLIGAGLMIAAYFIGVGLIGAAISSIALHVGWNYVAGHAPPTPAIVIVAVLGALGALSIARYVVVVGTALAGSWTLIVGALALAGDRIGADPITADNIWVVYALGPLPGRWWITALWFGVALAGVITQLATTGKTAGKKSLKPKA